MNATTAATAASTLRPSSGRFSQSPRIIAGLRTCQSATRPSTTWRKAPMGIDEATAYLVLQSTSATAIAMSSDGRQP